MLDLNKATEEMRTASGLLLNAGVNRANVAGTIGLELTPWPRLLADKVTRLAKFERGLNDLRVENYAKTLHPMDRIGAIRLPRSALRRTARTLRSIRRTAAKGLPHVKVGREMDSELAGMQIVLLELHGVAVGQQNCP